MFSLRKFAADFENPEKRQRREAIEKYQRAVSLIAQLPDGQTLINDVVGRFSKKAQENNLGIPVNVLLQPLVDIVFNIYVHLGHQNIKSPPLDCSPERWLEEQRQAHRDNRAMLELLSGPPTVQGMWAQYGFYIGKLVYRLQDSVDRQDEIIALFAYALYRFTERLPRWLRQSATSAQPNTKLSAQFTVAAEVETAFNDFVEVLNGLRLQELETLRFELLRKLRVYPLSTSRLGGRIDVALAARHAFR